MFKVISFNLGLTLVVSLFIASIASAHTSGASIEKKVGEYLLDVGYSPEIVSEGDQVRFDFDILNNDTQEGVEFDDIWVRIEKDGEVFLAGGLGKQKFGATGLTYNFLESGSYEIFVRYSKDSSSLAETSFRFAVTDVPTKTPFMELPIEQKVGPLLVGALLGIMLHWLVANRRKTSEV